MAGLAAVVTAIGSKAVKYVAVMYPLICERASSEVIVAYFRKIVWHKFVQPVWIFLNVSTILLKCHRDVEHRTIRFEIVADTDNRIQGGNQNAYKRL